MDFKKQDPGSEADPVIFLFIFFEGFIKSFSSGALGLIINAH